MNDQNPPRGCGDDPLIDEVRAIRRSICEEFGDDVDRLCDHLQEVESEYRTRTGRFADLPRHPSGELFPEVGSDQADPLMGEVRKLRR